MMVLINCSIILCNNETSASAWKLADCHISAHHFSTRSRIFIVYKDGVHSISLCVEGHIEHIALLWLAREANPLSFPHQHHSTNEDDHLSLRHTDTHTFCSLKATTLNAWACSPCTCVNGHIDHVAHWKHWRRRRLCRFRGSFLHSVWRNRLKTKKKRKKT